VFCCNENLRDGCLPDKSWDFSIGIFHPLIMDLTGPSKSKILATLCLVYRSLFHLIFQTLLVMIFCAMHFALNMLDFSGTALTLRILFKYYPFCPFGELFLSYCIFKSLTIGCNLELLITNE